MWITNGTLADVAVVWAQTDDGRSAGFVVPTDTPGFTATKIQRKLSLRASVTAELSSTTCGSRRRACSPTSAGSRAR